MQERRATARQRVFKTGSIEFDGASVDCTIRNLSSAGAALDVAKPLGIPHEITLNIVMRQMRQRGYIIWRKERRVGVAFVHDPENAALDYSVADAHSTFSGI
jgi:hypothetical protein